MIKVVKSFLLIVLAILFSNCSSMKNFTHETQQVNSFSEDELMGIQYFLSSPVTIQLKEKRRKSKITKDNEVDSKKVFYRKDIIIDEDIPGVAVKVNENLMNIKFSNDIQLGFNSLDSTNKSKYILSTFNGQDIENKGEVTYKNKQWKIRFGKPDTKFLGLFYNENRFDEKNVPCLLYKYSSENEKEYKVETVKGIPLN